MSDTIRIACPACGGKMKALAAQAGQQVECPRCGAKVTVPGAGAAQDHAPALTGAAGSLSESVSAASAAPPVAHGGSEAPAADARVVRAPRIWLRCSVCGSALSVVESLLGQTTRCPDCHAELPVERPVAKVEKAQRRAVEDSEYALSVPVTPPRYIPPVAAGVSEAELYDSPPVAPPADATLAPVVREREFAVPCPLCGTRLYAKLECVGRTMRCPDCHSQFEVKAPRQLPSATPAAPEPEQHDFRMSELFERPKYQPLARDAVPREELDAIDRERMRSAVAPSAEGTKPAAPAESARSPLAYEFFFACPICGTQLGGRRDQVGQAVRCVDCQSEVRVPAAPRPKSRSAASEPGQSPPAGSLSPAVSFPAPVPPAVPAKATQPVPPPAPGGGEHAHEVLARAEREHARDLETRVKLSDLPYAKRLLGIFGSSALVARGAMVALGLSFVLWLLKSIAGLWDGGAAMLWIVILIPFLAVSVMLTWSYWANSCIAVVQNTASGLASIDDWSDDMFMDVIGRGVATVVPVAAATVPGVLLAGMFSSLLPAWAVWVFPALSFFLCFPVFELSVLETGSSFGLISLAVLDTMTVARRAWARFYLESLVLVGLAAGLLGLAIHESALVRAGVALGIMAVSLVYFRALGVLAAVCSLAMRAVERAAAEQEGKSVPQPAEKNAAPPA